MINPKLIARIIANTDTRTKLRLAKVIPKLGKVDELTRCMLCPNMCLHTCPVFDAERRLTVSPSVKSRLAYFLREFPDRYDDFEAIFHCLPCNACKESCPMDISVNDALKEVRHLITGRVAGVAERIENRIREVEEVEISFHGKGEVLYFPGCSAVELKLHRTTIDVLEELDFSFEVSRSRCCGAPYAELGDVERFRKLFEKLKSEAKGYDGVISNCPSCVNLMRENGIKASHITIALLPLIPSGSEGSDGRRVVYHDPCVLARKLNVIEEPRGILRKLGFEVVEAQNSGRDTYCCGYGGIYRYFNEDGAKMVARKRLEQLSDAADLIATSCPTCVAGLKLADVNDACEVRDIVELVAEVLR